MTLSVAIKNEAVPSPSHVPAANKVKPARAKRRVAASGNIKNDAKIAKLRKSLKEQQHEDSDEDDEFKLMRLQKNRESAQKSRRRKKQYVEDLESKCVSLSDEVVGLSTELSSTKAQNKILKDEVEFLQRLIATSNLRHKLPQAAASKFTSPVVSTPMGANALAAAFSTEPAPTMPVAVAVPAAPTSAPTPAADLQANLQYLDMASAGLTDAMTESSSSNSFQFAGPASRPPKIEAPADAPMFFRQDSAQPSPSTDLLINSFLRQTSMEDIPMAMSNQ